MKKQFKIIGIVFLWFFGRIEKIVFNGKNMGKYIKGTTIKYLDIHNNITYKICEDLGIEINSGVEGIKKGLENKGYKGIRFIGSIFSIFSINPTIKDSNYNNLFKKIIESNEIKKLFTSENIKFSISENINFKKCTFEQDLKFENINFNSNVKFIFCNFNNLTFSEVIFSKNIDFLGCKINVNFKILKSNIKTYLNISGCIIVGILKIKNALFLEFYVNKILNLNLDLYNIEKIEKMNISKITHGCINIDDVYLSDSNSNVLSDSILDDFSVKNSNLGKTTFNGVKIDKLYLENATLNDCIFNGVEFPKNYELERGKLKNRQLKDNYRQLKHVMDSNGNITEANNFFEKEMEYYEKELAENGFSQKRVILLIQKWISNYGGNWLKPIGWIFILGLITVFISYCYMFNIKKIEIDFIKSFLSFLYPLYGLKKDFFEGFDKYMLFGFMSYKLIYGILLWHLVVALKRTTKR